MNLLNQLRKVRSSPLLLTCSYSYSVRFKGRSSPSPPRERAATEEPRAGESPPKKDPKVEELKKYGQVTKRNSAKREDRVEKK